MKIRNFVVSNAPNLNKQAVSCSSKFNYLSNLHYPIAVFLCYFLGFATIHAQDQIPSANYIIQQSISFHDPLSQWDTLQSSFLIEQSFHGNDKRITRIEIDSKKGKFNYKQTRDKNVIERHISPDTVYHLLNKSNAYSPENQKKFKLDNKTSLKIRDYYMYLLGLPMKLNEAKEFLEPKASLVNFKGEKLLKVAVKYREPVGKDNWYFYFDPNTFQLKAYQFFHKEEEKDGEYILLDDLIKINDLVLPKHRSWYFNKDGKYLGKDSLIKPSLNSKELE